MKNYTSTVDPETTIYRIENILARFGVSNVSKDYTNGDVSGIVFTLLMPDSPPMQVRLPANVDLVYEHLKKIGKRPTRTPIDVWQRRMKDQSRRTAWKLIQDWIEVQLSLVEMKQAEAAQVFLPYFWDGKKTFYAAIKERKFVGIVNKQEQPAQ